SGPRNTIPGLRTRSPTSCCRTATLPARSPPPTTRSRSSTRSMGSEPAGPGDTPRTASPDRARRELSDTQFALAIGMPVFLLLVLVVAYPLGYAIWMSVHKIIFFGGYRSSFVGAANFVRVLSDANFWWSTWVTLRLTVEAVILTMLLGLTLALM